MDPRHCPALPWGRFCPPSRVLFGRNCSHARVTRHRKNAEEEGVAIQTGQWFSCSIQSHKLNLNQHCAVYAQLYTQIKSKIQAKFPERTPRAGARVNSAGGGWPPRSLQQLFLLWLRFAAQLVLFAKDKCQECPADSQHRGAWQPCNDSLTSHRGGHQPLLYTAPCQKHFVHPLPRTNRRMGCQGRKPEAFAQMEPIASS